MMGDSYWCEVQRQQDSSAGWAAGRYLREASVGPAHPVTEPEPQGNG